MSYENAIDRLINEFYFKPTTAKAYIDFNGKCAYCGLELIGDKANYAAGTIDHLLPRTKYPGLIEDKDNCILSCLTCNSLKGILDVLEKGEDPIDAIKNHRVELIGRVKEVLDKQNKEYDKVIGAVTEIVGSGR